MNEENMFIKSVLLKSLYFQLYVTFDIDNFSEELLLYFHVQKNPGLSRFLASQDALEVMFVTDWLTD